MVNDSIADHSVAEDHSVAADRSAGTSAGTSAGNQAGPQEHSATGSLPQMGRHLLEASAGTGKTFAIAALVTRLIAEQDVTVDELLVVTFTRAAAAELRDRIRRRLSDAVRALQNPSLIVEGHDEIHDVLAACGSGELKERRQRLARAVIDFDTATITTIHGFCQQVLQSLGATSGHNPDVTLVQDTSDLVQGACSDVMAAAALHGEMPYTAQGLVKTVQAVLNNPGVEVVADSGDGGDDARRKMVVRAATEVRDRLGSTASLSFDVMLEAVRDALVAHPDAAQRLAQQFPVALVDEFQDTDPVQWAILSAIYAPDGEHRAGTRLVLVGDPKQAIYAFRGGDIHTYLAAARAAERRTLPVNWRSDGALLHTLNELCAGWELGDQEIRYLPVRPSPQHEDRRLVDADGHPVPAVDLRCAARGLEQKKPTKAGTSSVYADPARWACIDDAVRAIVEMLDSGWRIPCSDDDPGATGVPGERTRELRAGDIAVLVHANRWATPIQRSLVRSGVPAVVTGGSSVAESPAADQWRILLDALARPSDPTRARAVALSWFGDRDPQWVAASTLEGTDDQRLADLQSQLESWSALLRNQGVSALTSVLRSDVSLVASVLSLPGGERNLTDLDHLGELLHSATAGRPVGPESARALLDEMSTGSADDDPEAIKRRIDTDAPAVRIMTLHAAKGLEFPVVCCPSLWNVTPSHRDGRLYHNEHRGRLLDVSKDVKSIPLADAAAKAELVGQAQRLTYVGLTRAVHRLVLWWAAGPSAGNSPIAPLLFGDGGVSGVPDEHYGQLCDRVDASGLDGLVSVAEVQPHGQRIATRRTSDGPNRVPVAAADLSVAALTRSLERSQGRWSFSSLSARALDDDHISVGGEPSVVPSPSKGDPDDPSLGDAADGDEQLPPPPVLFDGLGAGAAFGTLVHDALEHLDFAGDLEAQLSAFLLTRPWAGDGARRERLVRAIAAAVRTPLGDSFDGIALASLVRSDRLDELEFELPLATTDAGMGGSTIDRRSTFDTTDIGRLLLEHCAEGDPVRGWAQRLADGVIDVSAGGHLTGSIDLVMRLAADVPGGYRYCVADYKTNRLGSWVEADRITNYRPDLLVDAMAHHHYPLQAVLYSVALHRYLRWRLPGYLPELHLGPVAYLFVRGMVGDATPQVDGRSHGVFDWQVPPAAVASLSDLLDGVVTGEPR